MNGWLLRRLSAMGPAEIALRARRALRDRRARARWRRGDPWSAAGPMPSPDAFVRGFADAPFALAGARIAAAARGWPAASTARIAGAAEEILDGRYRWLGRIVNLGPRPNWRRDTVSGVEFPAAHCSTLAANAPDGAFDMKHVWEPNLHEAFVTLAQAHLLTGDAKWRDHLIVLWRDWMEQNPPFGGPNYLAPIETGMRLLHWAAALRFWAAREAPPEPLLAEIFRHAVAQRRYVAGNLSRHSSANNHLLGELASLHCIDAAFPGIAPEAESLRWRGELIAETLRQFAPDGGNREQALHYHAFSLAFLLLALHTDRERGVRWAEAAEERIVEAGRFLLAALDAKGEPFLYGDSDDSEVLPLAPVPRPVYAPVLAHLDALFPHRLGARPGIDERTAWLAGTIPAPGDPTERVRPSARFVDSGHAFLRRGPLEAHLNGGNLGYLSIAAHGHEDALAVQIRRDGVPWTIDPGTFTYRGGAAWRERLVSAAAHPTVSVPGAPAAERRGPFLWTEHYPTALRTATEYTASAEIAVGRGRAIVLRRTVTLPDERTVRVEDRIDGPGPVSVRVHWPFGASEVEEVPGGVRVRREGAAFTLRTEGLPGPGRIEKGRSGNHETPCYSDRYDVLHEGSAWTWEGSLPLPAAWVSVFRDTS